MRPRFVGSLGVADAVTTANAALGFVAIVTATVDVSLAARIVLLAAITDAIDGILARKLGSSEVGDFLDSLADVASFCVAPALIVVETVGSGTIASIPVEYVAIAFGAAFVAMGVVRLGLYTAYDTADSYTDGVQTTLAATILSVGLIAGVPSQYLFWGLAVFAVLMVTPIRYPDLRVRDALVMGGVQALAIVFPTTWDGMFPKVLLAWALGYLVLAPRFYPRTEGKRS